jgi:transposase
MRLLNDTKQTALRKKGEKFNRACVNQKVKHPGSVMVWSTISMRGLGPIYIVKDTMKHQQYIQVLKNELLPNIPRWYSRREKPTFMQDKAPPHTAKATKEFMKQAQLNILDWPGNSPDMNPIENVWAVLKKEVAKLKPSSIAELIAAIKFVWYNSPLIKQTAEASIMSMPKRLKDLIAAKGYQTKY